MMPVGKFIIKRINEEKKAKKCDATVVFLWVSGLFSNKWNFRVTVAVAPGSGTRGIVFGCF